MGGGSGSFLLNPDDGMTETKKDENLLRSFHPGFDHFPDVMEKEMSYVAGTSNTELPITLKADKSTAFTAGSSWPY